MATAAETTMEAVADMLKPWFFDVLPFRPIPYPEECLSGYLVRLAEANGEVRLWDLVGDLFPRWVGPQQLALLRWEYPVDDWGGCRCEHSSQAPT